MCLIHDATVTQEDDPVGPGRMRRVMGDQDAGPTLVAMPAQESHHRFAGDGVEGTGRLVGEDDAAAADQGACDGHPLLFAAREVVRESVREGGEAD